MSTTPRPQKIVSVTAKHRISGDLEHYRSRDTNASKETVIARFGHFLGTLGWKPEDIIILGARTEREDVTTMAIRNRMIRPRA